ncbi:MAG TPA: glycosyltransferase [Candidatus Dormibacteraeota bacterium]|jgi:glycosyltransferase involved in cell wall biosynthesis|nr:glycosyltransferase [Candidatus Dormibacteraeota bacterium]
MSRVLVVSNDLVQPRMAGPGIRNLELARQLAAAGHEVTLSAPGVPVVEDRAFAVTGHDEAGLRRLAAGHDVILSQGWVLHTFPFLRGGRAALVVDLYDPFPLETLVAMGHAPLAERTALQDHQVEVLVEQIRDGDLFLCASERQRDYWLGALTALGRINPRTYDADPTLRRLLDVVPFGIPEEPPQHRAPAMRGVIPGIGAGDYVVLWGGGLYNWFDPLTLLRGVALAAEQAPTLRLVLHAARHPNPSVGAMRVVEETRQLSDELGLTGRHVFFNEAWVPYEQRADWLLEADVGVTTHRLHVESRLAFRTRVLDYLWAGLPILCTAGDALADTVESAGLGITVAPGDPGEVAAALRTLADPGRRAEISQRVAVHAGSLTWSRTAAPLLAFCAAPSHAPDRRGAGERPVEPRPAASPPPPHRLGRLLRRVGEELSAGGAGAVAGGGVRWLRRRWARIAGRTGAL